ncbi:PepSY-associated TM helix domain-containing protein [Acinetobacter zhairhuonensis]|uniref:PepSY-associated TM helix domain-containing protein n=1 Tax=Acinetobacter sp. A7.4 TaxID=2919921 RepID=UPI001F4F1AC6|nr:PepSY-associated TM helix domain-containing protein [Acinetobacter sp. A7.4]MCJ8161231.1 PepSY domain-containing protein [Acinetobacter sp. A7.4]
MLKSLLRLSHSQLGLLIAPFIFIAALTGLLYALTPQIEQSIYHQQLFAEHEVGALAQPLSLQVKAAQEVLPKDAQIIAIRTAPTENSTTRILYQGSQDSITSMAIFVNPYTLKVQGQLAAYGTSGVLPVRTFLDQVHRNLLLGEWGRLYSELAASWLGIFTLTGLLQWWLKRKQIKTSAHQRNRFIKWHYLTALLILPMLLFLSITGLTWSKWSGANIAEIRHWLNSDTPTLNRQIQMTSHSQHVDPHAEHHGKMNMSSDMKVLDFDYFDQMVTIARANGLMATALQIKPSYQHNQAWTVEEINHRHPIQIDALAVDIAQQKVIDQVHFKDFPLSAKLTRWGVDMHIGVLFGWWNQLILVLSALGILMITAFAYRAWWSYSRPAESIQQLNKSLSQLWQQGNLLPLSILIMSLVLLYFLVPVWVVSIVVLHIIFAVGQLFKQIKH